MAINAGSVYSELVLNGDKYFSTLAKADTRMKTFEGKLSSYGQKMEKLGSSWTKKVSLPLAGVGAAAVKVGIDFESGMSEVQAISGATGEDLEKLEDRARELAKETKFSATEAADGLKYMSLAGWEVEEMYTALPAVLDLATAANMDLARASDIVTDTMSAYQMEADEATKASDIFAQTQAKSNTNIEQLGEAMKYAGAAANSANMDLEETNTVLGILADSGIKGSMAGTTFTAMLRDMKKNADDGKVSIGDMSIALYDAEGNMRDMGDIMYEFEQATKDMTTAQKDAELASVFGEQALKGMNIVLATGSDRYNELEDSIRNSEGAAKDMANTMQDNLKGKWESLKSSLSEVGIQISEILIPMLSKGAEKLSEWVDWFGSLNESTQETIVKIGGLALAIGPLLLAGGKVLKGGSAVVGLLGKISGGATLASGASTTLAGGLGATGAAAKASALLFNPWVAGATAAAGAGYLIYKELNERVIPEVEIFDETVSDATKEVVGNFLDMEKESTLALNQLAWSGAEITEEIKTDMVTKYGAMKDEVIGKLQEQKTDALSELEEMLKNSTDITEEEKAEMIRITGEKYDEMIEKTETDNARIAEILELAKEENRTITDEEKEEILEIKEQMKEDGITLLSETQEESETILKNLKENADTLTAEMAAEVVKNSKEQKEQTIENARVEYQDRLKYAEDLKRDGSKESVDLANRIIKEAERQYNETVSTAGKMHRDVVKEAKEQAKEHIDVIDWETGELKSKWESLKTWYSNNPIIRWIKTKTEAAPKYSSIGNNAHGTNYWGGGLTWVGEQGRELIELPQATKVHSNQKSEQIVRGEKGITQNITINSPAPLSPSEVARKNLQISRQLAMEWGV